MKKPPALLLKLCDIYPFKTMSVDLVLYDTDKTKTLVYFNGYTVGELEKVDEFVDWVPDYRSCCAVKPECAEWVAKWKDYEEENQLELKEYERLKKKYGD